jgi:hypothetical protein
MKINTIKISNIVNELVMQSMSHFLKRQMSQLERDQFQVAK